MKKIVTASAFALLMGMGSAFAQTTPTTPSTPGGTAQPKMQMTQAQCESLWSKINPSSAASVSQSQAQAYTTSFTQVDTNSDGQLSSAEFLKGCQAGMFMDSATTGSGTGSTGSSTTNPAVKK